MTRIGSKPPVWIRPDTPPETIPKETPPPISEKVPFGTTPWPLPTLGPKTVAGLREVFDQFAEDKWATEAVDELKDAGRAEVSVPAFERTHKQSPWFEWASMALTPVDEEGKPIKRKNGTDLSYVVELNYAGDVEIHSTYEGRDHVVRSEASRVKLYKVLENSLKDLNPGSEEAKAVRVAMDILTSQTHGINQQVLGLQDQNRTYASGEIVRESDGVEWVKLHFKNLDGKTKTAEVDSSGFVQYKQEDVYTQEERVQELRPDARRLLAAQIKRFRPEAEANRKLSVAVQQSFLAVLEQDSVSDEMLDVISKTSIEEQEDWKEANVPLAQAFDIVLDLANSNRDNVAAGAAMDKLMRAYSDPGAPRSDLETVVKAATDRVESLDKATELLRQRNLPPWELDPQESWHWHNKK